MANDSANADPVCVAVGARIRALRRERGMTQVQLAAAARVSQPFVSSDEAGNQNLELLKLSRIADALGASVADVVADIRPMALTAARPRR